MRVAKLRILVVGLAVLATALVPRLARAEPSPEQQARYAFSVLGLVGMEAQVGGALGASPYRLGVVEGVNFGIGPASATVLIGARLVQSPQSSGAPMRSLALLDVGLRVAPNLDAKGGGLFFGAGVSHGTQHVEGFRYGTTLLGHGEFGYRTGTWYRLFGGMRVDAGGAWTRDVSRVQAAPFVGSVSIFFGVGVGNILRPFSNIETR